MKIVRTKNLKKKEKNSFMRRDHHNRYVRSTEENVNLVLMIKGNIYMPFKRSRGAKFITVKEKYYNF